MTVIDIESRTQRIVVNPASTAIAVINAGPQGPGGSGGGGGGGDISEAIDYTNAQLANVRLEAKWTTDWFLLDGSAIPTNGFRPITFNSQHDAAADIPPGPFHTADEWHYKKSAA